MSAIDIQPKPETRVRAALAGRGRWVVLAVLLIALAALGVKGWLVYGRLRAVRADVRSLQTLAQAPRDEAMVAGMGAQLALTRADVGALRAEVGPFLPLTPYLGWVPTYGSDLVAAAPLLDAGADLSAAADDAFAAFGPLLAAQAAGPISGAQLRERVAAAGPQIEAARAALDRAAASWAHISIAQLSPELREPLARADQALPLARLALALAPNLPDVLDDLQQLAPYSHGQPDKDRLAALGPLLAKTRADVARLRAAGAGSAAATAVPEAAPLLDTAAELSAAADDAFQALSPIVLARGDRKPIGEAMAEQLSSAGPQIEAARAAAGRAADAWATIKLDQLPDALSSRLKPIGALAASLREGLALAQVLPNMLGVDKPAEYLLLAQNPDELRATGGFIGAAGVVTVQRGRVGAIALQNSPSVDDYANQVYPDPPAPMLRYMNIEMWLFRDANWSPDFPTAARQARDLYAIGQGHAPANVVAFDPIAAQYVLAAIGPVTVEGNPAPVTAENVFAYLRSEHDQQKGVANPKAYIGQLASAMIAKVVAQASSIDIWQLAQAMRRSLAERHLLISAESAGAAQLFARHGWDGAVRPGPADFLMVVDANMSYNKVNPNIDEALDYTVDLSDPGAPVATLVVRHTNKVALEKPCKQFVDEDQSYAEWMQHCYYDYMRVLAPRGVKLGKTTTVAVPDAWMESGAGDDGAVKQAEGAAGSSELNVFQVIGYGETRATMFRYRLPANMLARDDAGWHYRLHLQKQPGTLGNQYSVTVKLPPRVTLSAATPAPAGNADGTLHFTGSLATDQSIHITFHS